MKLYMVESEGDTSRVEVSKKRVRIHSPNSRFHTDIIDHGNGWVIKDSVAGHETHLSYCDVADLLIAFAIRNHEGQNVCNFRIYGEPIARITSKWEKNK
jgi:hypothetical protein